jgi:serine protease Do
MFVRPTHLVLVAAGLALSVTPLAAQAPADLEDLQQQAIRAAAAAVAPSVVQIETSGGSDIVTYTTRGGTSRIRKGMGPTSGLVVAEDGFVLSSTFNFVNKPSSIFVSVPGHKERYVAKVVAQDTTRMVTMLKIDAKGLKVPEAAPRKELQVGQTAIALGRTLDDTDRPPSFSVGILSALHRIWGKAVQTDAKISPTNYGGPLIDLQGRVIGILVSATPFEEDATAGAIWYDSGIGFAVPLEDLNVVLPKLKAGQSLKRGLLGVEPKSADNYAEGARVGVVRPNSAAAKANIQPDDVILEIDGKPVGSQAHVLHLLGPKYEGDTASIKIQRGKDVIDLGKVTLGGQQAAVAQAFLGIVPVRDDPEPGVEVRYVFPKSPADGAGIKEGDRIMGIGPKTGPPPRPFTGRDQFIDLMRRLQLQAGSEVKLQVKRKAGGKTDTLEIKLAEAPNDVPKEGEMPEVASARKAQTPPKPPVGPMPMPTPPRPMPPPGGNNGTALADEKDDKKEEKKDEKPDEKKEEKKFETGLLERKNPAGAVSHWLYVPRNYDPNVRYALVVWLHPVGKNKKQDVEDLTDTWDDYCRTNNIILVGPKAESDTGWLASEADVVSAACQDAFANYQIDRRRVVVHGMGQGGQFAFYLGFQARDLFRGVATTGSVLANPAKERDPNKPLSFFVVAGGKDPLAKPIAETRDKLLAQKHPVVHREIPDMGHQYLDLKTLEELVRWIDSLDRI